MTLEEQKQEMGGKNNDRVLRKLHLFLAEGNRKCWTGNYNTLRLLFFTSGFIGHSKRYCITFLIVFLS